MLIFLVFSGVKGQNHWIYQGRHVISEWDATFSTSTFYEFFQIWKETPRHASHQLFSVKMCLIDAVSASGMSLVSLMSPACLIFGLSWCKKSSLCPVSRMRFISKYKPKTLHKAIDVTNCYKLKISLRINKIFLIQIQILNCNKRGWV